MSRAAAPSSATPGGAVVDRGDATPDGYLHRVTRGVETVAHQSVAPAIETVLADGTSLYEWAATVPQPHALRGRAPVYVATLPDTSITVVVRHVWHGGLLAPLTADRFRMPTRAPLELRNALRLRALGIPTTEILAHARYPAGPGLRRVDVVSRFVPDAFDFGAALAGLPPAPQGEPSRARMLAAVSQLLRRLAAHRVLHPDLNVKNILLTQAADGAVVARIIDVDVVRFDDREDATRIARANGARLLRSMRKWRVRVGAPIDDALLAAFERSCMDGGA